MKTVKLSIFDDFKCIASNCKDSCCNAGWQIDIDNKTMQKYSFCDDPFTQNIRKHIIKNGKQYCVGCDENGRCPFFRDDGLCDIVKNKGDGYLCEVCQNFPRINIFVGDRLEQMLSLACEEVVRLVLTKPKIEFVYQNTKKEFLLSNKDFATRQNLMDYLQSESHSFSDKIEHFKKQCKYNEIDFKKIKSVLSDCEWLKNDFLVLDFEDYISCSNPMFCLRENQLENIFVCFLFRYISNPEFDKYSLNSKLRFCIFSILFCDYLGAKKQQSNSKSFDVDAIKEYSREIENSSKNVDILLKFFNF